MTGALYRLGKFAVSHRVQVLIVWVVAALALTLFAHHAGQQETDNLSLPGSDSQKATDLLSDEFPTQANGSNPVVFKAKDGQVTDSAHSPSVTAAVEALQKDKGVQSVISPQDPAGAKQVSPDQTISYASVFLKDSPSELSVSEADRIRDEVDKAAGSGLEVATGGYLGQKLSKPSTESSEVVGLTAAVIVLLLTFGTVVAMGLPIITALFGLSIGLALITLFGHVAEVPTIGPTLATMIGLGVGIDYALFVVTRHRAAMKDGHEPDEAAVRAAATAGGAIVFAGTTVVIALVSLSVAGIPLVSALGVTAAIAVLVAVLAAITLMPAVLSLIGHRIDSLPIPIGNSDPHDTHPHGWLRWAEFIARWRWPAAVAALVVLALLAFPMRKLELGQADNGSLPKSTETRQSYDLLRDGFEVGLNGPLLISVKQNPASTSPENSTLTELSQAIAGQKGIASVSPPQVNSNGTAAIITAIPKAAPDSDSTKDAVNGLRSTTIPKALKGTKTQAFVGGTTAGYIDLASEISDKLPLVIGVVVLLSFVVLMLAFRSILVPLEAALMNLVSVGASYGVITFVFQEGHGVGLVGLDHAVPIVSFLPLMMFAILFGLSMDYQVFLLTGIREAYARNRDNRKAVIEGLAHSGRVITSAALIMVSVFSSFILNGDPTVKQFGVGLAVAIAVDATIVRCLLVPSIMLLVGRRNWWMPDWLDRVLPDIDVEGNEYFERS